MIFKDGDIKGIILKKLHVHGDSRGSLTELFRQDELPQDIFPVMGYVSITKPTIARGPHSHIKQTDIFCFTGPSDFTFFCWDNRPDSATYLNRKRLIIGESMPMLVIIPPGIVHGYKNTGLSDGIVFNFADQLYRGEGRTCEVDEVRHEDDPDDPFRKDFENY